MQVIYDHRNQSSKTMGRAVSWRSCKLIKEPNFSFTVNQNLCEFWLKKWRWILSFRVFFSLINPQNQLLMLCAPVKSKSFSKGLLSSITLFRSQCLFWSEVEISSKEQGYSNQTYSIFPSQQKVEMGGNKDTLFWLVQYPLWNKDSWEL